MHSLPILVRLKGRSVILIGKGEAADAKARLLGRAGAVLVDEDEEAQLAIVAVDDPEPVVARLKRRGILVNAVDRPELCDFTVPAIVDRDPVLIAIGTGGASAGLAKALRQRLERMLPAALGALARGLHKRRGRIRERWPEPADRRRAIDAALEEGGPLDPFVTEADVESWLNAPPSAVETGLIRLVLSSRDPDDLTLRQARLLGRADRLYHRPDVPAAILSRARADAARIPCAEAPARSGSGLSLDLAMSPA